MHVIKPYETAVTLFRRDGEVWVYQSLYEAYKALGLGWINRNVNPHFVTYRTREVLLVDGQWVRGKRLYDYAEFVMRDDVGRALTVHDFERFRPKNTPWYLRPYLQWNGQGPVPKTRKDKASQDCNRTVAQGNALRNSVTFSEEGEVAPRAKRILKPFADRWDDYYPEDRTQKNWKAYRRTQWRA